LKQSGLRIWQFDQRHGDLVIVPPGVAHQVLNVVCRSTACSDISSNGGSQVRTDFGVAINKGTGTSLAIAANLISPSFLHLCWQSEKFNRTLQVRSVYRLKAAVYFGVKAEVHWMSNNAVACHEPTPECTHHATQLEQLLAVYREILQEEEVPSMCIAPPLRMPDTDEFPHRRTCDVCMCDIFNRRFHCSLCGIDPVDGWDLCIQCHTAQLVGGPHRHTLVLIETIALNELWQLANNAASALLQYRESLQRQQCDRQAPVLQQPQEQQQQQQ
jgi:hypothetical protein